MTHFESGYGDTVVGDHGIRNIADFVAISGTQGHRRTRISTQYRIREDYQSVPPIRPKHPPNLAKTLPKVPKPRLQMLTNSTRRRI